MNHHNHRESRIENRVSNIDNPIIYVPIRHYICRESSTNQLFFRKTNPIFKMLKFMQTQYLQRITKILSRWRGTKTNPIKPKSNPICEKPKMNLNTYPTRDYSNKTAIRQIQNKPNQSQLQTQFTKGQNELKIAF